MHSLGCLLPRRTNGCANLAAPKSWLTDAARPPDMLIRAFSTPSLRPTPIKISSAGQQKQHHKPLITPPGSAKPRSPAKLQGDLSYTKRAEAISPSGVRYTLAPPWPHLSLCRNPQPLTRLNYIPGSCRIRCRRRKRPHGSL